MKHTSGAVKANSKILFQCRDIRQKLPKSWLFAIFQFFAFLRYEKEFQNLPRGRYFYGPRDVITLGIEKVKLWTFGVGGVATDLLCQAAPHFQLLPTLYLLRTPLFINLALVFLQNSYPTCKVALVRKSPSKKFAAKIRSPHIWSSMHHLPFKN